MANPSVAVLPSVVALHRYPVKSMLGEQLDKIDLDERGVVGDRQWSVRTSIGKIGSGKSTRRFAAVIGLLELRARQRDDAVHVEFPDGSSMRMHDECVADRLTDFLGQGVTVASETDVSHFDDGPVSLLGLASVEALSAYRGMPVDIARFRANIVLRTTRAMEEDDWVGHDVSVGSAVLRVEMRSPRCVMVNMKSADLPDQPGNLAALGDLSDGHLGVVARVVRPGTVRVGDSVLVM